MHHKKSEIQIGKESSGISSGFNPKPPLLPLHQKHIQIFSPSTSPPRNKADDAATTDALQILIPKNFGCDSPFYPQSPNDSDKNNGSSFFSTPHKRTLNSNNPSSFSQLQSLNSIPLTVSSSYVRKVASSSSTSSSSSSHHLPPPNKLAIRIAFRILWQLRRLHLRLRLLFFACPILYLFLSNPAGSLLLNVLSVLAFLAALLFSLNSALPRLSSICLHLRRAFPLKFSSSLLLGPAQPVLWSIGSSSEKRTDSGNWVQVYSNGDVFEGEFRGGKCSGRGVYYYYMSGRYEGDWVDDKCDGHGVESWVRGSRYRGQYRRGLRHGYGVYRFYSGDVYSGEWSHGQSHGSGAHTCQDGSRYVGEFKWGVKHGLGNYHFRNGDTYFGEYFADRMHGFGVYHFANGHCYEGAWHEGRRQGLGMYTFRNGETHSGHWQNGVLNSLSTHNGNASFPVAVSHSKVLNAVQEARCAAEKALDVMRVDDRVNKAVTTANKAAIAARVAAAKAIQKRRMKNVKDIPIPIV